MVASILKISISQNPNCDNLVGFPKSGHIYIAIKFLTLEAQEDGGSLLRIDFQTLFCHWMPLL